MAIGIVSDSHPHDDQQFVGYNDIIGTVTEEIIATTTNFDKDFGEEVNLVLASR